MRTFWHSYVFMKYVLPTLSDRKRKIRSAVRLSPRSFPIGVGTKKCIDERSASGGGFPLSEKKSSTVETLDFTRFCKKFLCHLSTR